MTVSSPIEALLSAYPRQFTSGTAERWVLARRLLLNQRISPSDDLVLAVSSGCAASGARAHARELAHDAAYALSRLDAGLGTTCERCSMTLPIERLDSAPTAVRCTGCATPSKADTRWCR